MSVSVPWISAIVPLKTPAAGTQPQASGDGAASAKSAELMSVSVPAALRLALWVAVAAGPAEPSKLLVPGRGRGRPCR